MNRNRFTSNKRPFTFAISAALCAVMVAGLTGCGLRRNTQPPVPPTSAPIQPTQAQVTEAAQPTDAGQPAGGEQPTAAPAQPTAPQPTEAPTEAVQQPDTQGDEIEQLLDLLDQQNQKADPLDDVPQ